MAGRYLLTGVQLGMLTGIDSFDERNKMLLKIIDDQYIGQSNRSILEDVEWHRKKDWERKS